MSRFAVLKAFFHKHNELNTPNPSVHFLGITCKLYPGSDLSDHFHPPTQDQQSLALGLL